MRLGTATTAAFLLGVIPISAQTGLDSVVRELERQGYTGIEVEQRGGHIIVEGRRAGAERSLIYDAGSGRLISDDTGNRGDDDDDDRGRRGADDDDDDDDGGGGNGGGGNDDDRGGDNDDD